MSERPPAMVTGGCLCGQTRFRCAEVGPAGYCHCEDCRRCTGSVLNVSVRCPASGFAVEGSLGGVTKAGAGGQPLTRHFCRGCGSPVYTSSPRHPDAVFVKGCAFDDPGSVLPATEAWTCSEVPWARIPAGLSRHRRDKAP